MKILIVITTSILFFLANSADTQDAICGNVYKGYVVILSSGIEKGSVMTNVDRFFIDTIPKFSKKELININSFFEKGGVLLNYNHYLNRFSSELYESKILKRLSYYDPYMSQKIKDKYIDYYRVFIVGNIKDTSILSYVAPNGQNGTAHSKTFIDVQKVLDKKYKILLPEIIIPY